jgi:hypothetical protein
MLEKNNGTFQKQKYMGTAKATPNKYPGDDARYVPVPYYQGLLRTDKNIR